MKALAQNLYNKPFHKKILCVANNFTGSKLPNPVLYDKPFSSLAKSGAKVQIRANQNLKVDASTGIVFGQSIERKGRFSQPYDLNAKVLGHFLALEFTEEALYTKFKSDSSPWMASKAADNFCVVSDLVNMDTYPDYSLNDAQVELSINGKIRDSVMISQQHYSLEELVDHITSYMTINEGDMLLTGSYHHEVTPFLDVGDEIGG